MLNQFVKALIGVATVSALEQPEKDDSWIDAFVEERRAKIAAGEDVDQLTIHLVPHTHDDVGWLKTIDGYYSGIDQDIAVANVSEILNSVIDQLIVHEDKVFTYVEMKFFSMWFYR